MFRTFIYVTPAVLLMAYSLVILKWRIAQLDIASGSLTATFLSVLKVLLDPYIISAFLSGFIAALIWIMAMSKLELSVAFPYYYGLTFILVLLSSYFILGESMTIVKTAGIVLIVIGIVIGNMQS